MEEFSQKALKDFISEAEEILENMGQDILKVEAQAGGAIDPDLVNGLFRGAHSLKGVSGMFGLANVSRLAHRLEDLLDQMRLGKITLGEEVLDFLLDGVALLRDSVAKVSANLADIDEDDVLPFEAKVDRFIKTQQKTSSDDPLAQLDVGEELLGVLTEYEEHRLRENVRMGRNILRASLKFPLMAFDERLSAATAKIKEIGELITTLPSALEAAPDQLAFDLLIGTTRDRDAVADMLAADDPVVQQIPRRAPPPAPIADPMADTGDTDTLRSIAKTVRVDIERIDKISNIVGELVLIKSTISRLAEQIRQTSGDATAIELGKQAKLLDRKLRELQQRVMDVRMVPLRQVFDKLNRIVRKTSRDLGKEIELVIQGADTELDKLLIEDLADPLMHIVRNAIDHGIEDPVERAASGKPPTGLLSIRAYQKGNHVVIEIADNGRGIDPQRVLAKAVERGLVRSDQELSQEEILALLFEPGFSTKDEVSEISGRGVGLDVVKNNVAAMGGMIEIQSTPGLGTTFYLTLPITLAIIQALLVETCGTRFAIPLNAVQEGLAISSDSIQTLENREVMQHRDTTLPLIRLEQTFALTRHGPPPAEPFVVVVGIAEKRMGLIVDGMRGQQDVVIKPIGSILRQTPGIAGATDMGDSQTVLVLDVAAIIEETAKHVHA